MTLSFDQFTEQAIKIINIDLKGYKIKRVRRRTDSIMMKYNITNYQDCLNLLKKDPKFKEAYLDYFTINTSEFYRNPQNFKYLENNIFPGLFKQNRRIKI